MSDVDVDSMRHLGPSDSGLEVASPTYTDSFHHSRTKPFSGDVVMRRDRSRESRDGSRGRGGAQQSHRDAASSAQNRLLSSSPGSRVPRHYRGREKKYHGSETYHEDSERPVDERRHSPSSDRHERYLDDTRRGKFSPLRDSHHDSDKRHGRSSSPRHYPRANEYSEHPRDRSFSPSSRKRPRSRSPLPFPPSRSKRSKRDRDRDRRRRAEKEERFERDHQKAHGPPRPDRAHSSSRKRSISPHYDASHHRRYAERGDHSNESRPRHRSRSPHWEANPDDRPIKPPSRSHLDPKIRDRSVSPRPGSRRSSFSHTHSPSRSIGRPPPRGPSDMGPYSRRPSPFFEPPRAEYPRSPKDRGSRRPRRKTKNREEAKFLPGGPLASGANSIEVSFRRTDRRSSFESSGHFEDPAPGQVSPHPDPNVLHYGSPSSPQSYTLTRPSKGSDRQHSPRSQHIRDRSHPIAPGRRFGSQSPPQSPSDPTSATASRGRGFSRGGFRGGMASAHSGLNNNISSRHSQWAEQAGSIRDGSGSFDHPMFPRPGTPSVKDEDREGENALKPPRDTQVEDAPINERAAIDQMPPPRPPPTAPTGPASSKFSFAFKASNKNPVAAPKPEISQKFSAAPRNETQPIIHDRDRDLPKDTPREPASARARAEYHNRRAPQPEQPRTRKVMKTRRKLKPKPPLDPELAQSVSVYFRKPGNESVIGSGTYGKVFKGKHVYTKKLVALKRIRMEGERDGFPVTAMREVKLLQSLRHTNIVHLHEVMIEKNECYMIFEYLSHDLTGLLNHPTYKLDAAQKKHLAMQLFSGLDYLHKRGVLHRDIKAANILVSSDGILKLADFGLARFYAKRDQHNYTNRVITIWYRPPELLLGETQYGAAVDIWSAACVMVEIFTRRAIFPGDGGEINQLEKIYDILGTPNQEQWPGFIHTPWFELIPRGHRRPNVFADKYRERVPAAAFDLLVEMFQFDPVKRPSAADVLEHPYFTIEQPPPRQAVELKNIKGDWHEFESKALRREKEKQERQQRDARRAAGVKDDGREKERKRASSSHEAWPEHKRPHVEGPAPNAIRESTSDVLSLSRNADPDQIKQGSTIAD